MREIPTQHRGSQETLVGINNDRANEMSESEHLPRERGALHTTSTLPHLNRERPRAKVGPNGLPDRPLKGVGQGGECCRKRSNKQHKSKQPTYPSIEKSKENTKQQEVVPQQGNLMAFHPCALATKPLRYT